MEYHSKNFVARQSNPIPQPLMIYEYRFSREALSPGPHSDLSFHLLLLTREFSSSLLVEFCFSTRPISLREEGIVRLFGIPFAFFSTALDLRFSLPELDLLKLSTTPCPCMCILRKGNKNRNRMRMRRRMGMLRRRHGTHVVLVLPFVGGRARSQPVWQLARSPVVRLW